LEQHDWPGNVRELSHVIERGVTMSTSAWIDVEDIGLAEEPPPARSMSPRNLDAAAPEATFSSDLYSALCTEGSVRSALSNTLTVYQLPYPVCAAAPTGTGSPGLALNHVGGTRGATRWTLSSTIDANLTS